MRASDLVATTGGCAANAAVAVARLGGRARFSGPVGTDDASRRFLDALAKTGVDPSGVLAVEGGSISVSGIFIDRDGEKMVATLHGRGLDGATPPDAAALVADIDVLLVDNRFPEFVEPICRAAAARGIPVVLDVDKATRLDDPLFATASHLIFSSEALTATTGIGRPRRGARSASPPASAASSPSPTARTTCCGSSAARSGGCRCSRSRRSTRWAPAIPSTAASRWRWPRAGTRSPPCGSARPRRRSNAPVLAVFRARPGRDEVEALLGQATGLEIE